MSAPFGFKQLDPNEKPDIFDILLIDLVSFSFKHPDDYKSISVLSLSFNKF